MGSIDFILPILENFMFLKNRVIIGPTDISIVAGNYTVKIENSIDQVETRNATRINTIISIAKDVVKRYPESKYEVGSITSDIIDIEDALTDKSNYPKFIKDNILSSINACVAFKSFRDEVSKVCDLDIINYYYFLYDSYTLDVSLTELPIYKTISIELDLDTEQKIDSPLNITSFYKMGMLRIVDSDFAYENEGSPILRPRFPCVADNIIAVKLDMYHQRKISILYDKNKDQKSSYIKILFEV